MINLNDLPYPMFPLSKIERELLTNVYSVYKYGKPNEFLCINLHQWMRMNVPSNLKQQWKDSRKLESKIIKSLEGLNTLNTYLCNKLGTDTLEDWDEETNIKARKIWIEKLLAQTGETI